MTEPAFLVHHPAKLSRPEPKPSPTKPKTAKNRAPPPPEPQPRPSAETPGRELVGGWMGGWVCGWGGAWVGVDGWVGLILESKMMVMPSNQGSLESPPALTWRWIDGISTSQGTPGEPPGPHLALWSAWDRFESSRCRTIRGPWRALRRSPGAGLAA